MFARWRNLAAAAGAFCFPVSLAHASLQSDDIHCTRSPACTRTQETSERDWFRRDRDAWYQRYYDSTIDEAAPDYQFTPRDAELPTKPAVIISNIAPIQDDFSYGCDDAMNREMGDEMSWFADDFDGEDMADLDDSFQTETRSSTTLEQPQFDIESELFDVYTPDARLEPFIIPSNSTPAARLTGTIEPIFDDSELECLDEWFCGDRPARDQQIIILDGIDPLPANPDDDFDSFDLDDDAIETTPELTPPITPKYHMFYPGCDWSPYYPESRAGQPAPPALPEDLRSA